MPKKLPIFYSAILLTGVNLLLRLVGTSFQVFLSSRIGAEGIGLLQLVMSVGSMATVAGMAGIRTAAMYLTAEEVGKERPGNIPWILSGCLKYSVSCSCAVAAVLYLFAPFIAGSWIGKPAVMDAIRLFACFLPVSCLTGVMVGCFTGAGRIGTLSAVEVAEQLCSIICTVFLLQTWAGSNPVKACQSVILGSGLSGCFTLVCLVFLQYRDRIQPGPRITVAGRMKSTAVPLAMADNLRTGISTVENLMVPRRLALYSGMLTPLAAFGTLSGMVFPILMFPAALLFGLTELLIPELARCNASGSRLRIHYLVRKCLRFGLLYGTFCAGCLFLNARELCDSLYGSSSAGTYLRWFAPLAVLLYCDSVTDAMIKGLGQQTYSVRYNIITNILDVTLLYFLLPRYGVFGYYISFLVTHILNYWLSLRRLLHITKEQISRKVPALTLCAAAAAVAVSGLLRDPFARAIAYPVILTCLLFLLGVLSREDLLWIKGLIRQK